MMPRGAVDRSAPCEVVQSKDKAYPRTKVSGRTTYIHRIAFEEAKGPLLPGETVDHVCFNKHCRQPLHLEAVSAAENTRRAQVAGSPARTRPSAVEPGVSKCIHGHEPNWTRRGGKLVCRDCRREQTRAWRKHR